MYTNGWDRWGDAYREQFAPVMEWMCGAARLAPGMTTLDVACGTGQPALPAAERVRPGGRVVAIDVDPTMVAATRRRAAGAGLDNVEALQMTMAALGFADASFDAVTLGFALMFSPEPVAVAQEVRRVLRPGGRFAVAVWDGPEKNPFFTTVFGPLAEVSGRPPPAPGAPGPFGLAAPGRLASVIEAAGLADVEVAPVAFAYESPSVEAHWQMLRDMALQSRLDALPPADAARVRDRVVEALAPYLDASRVRAPLTALCACARRDGRREARPLP